MRAGYLEGAGCGLFVLARRDWRAGHLEGSEDNVRSSNCVTEYFRRNMLIVAISPNDESLPRAFCHSILPLPPGSARHADLAFTSYCLHIFSREALARVREPRVGPPFNHARKRGRGRSRNKTRKRRSDGTRPSATY